MADVTQTYEQVKSIGKSCIFCFCVNILLPRDTNHIHDETVSNEGDQSNEHIADGQQGGHSAGHLNNQKSWKLSWTWGCNHHLIKRRKGLTDDVKFTRIVQTKLSWWSSKSCPGNKVWSLYCVRRNLHFFILLKLQRKECMELLQYWTNPFLLSQLVKVC